MTSDNPLRRAIASRSPEGWTPPTTEEQERMKSAHEAQLRAEHEETQLLATGDHLRACGVGAELLEALLRPAALQESQARAAVRAFLANSDQFALLMLGAPSSGKTLAAAESFLSLKTPIDSPYFGRSWMWGRPGQMLKAQRLAALSAYGDDRVEFARLAALPLLVVDEIGAERVPLVGALDDLIDERYSERRKVILTSNLAMPAFRERYDDRIYERIRHRGVAVACAGNFRHSSKVTP